MMTIIITMAIITLILTFGAFCIGMFTEIDERVFFGMIATAIVLLATMFILTMIMAIPYF